jgi:hypothetical protein
MPEWLIFGPEGKGVPLALAGEDCIYERIPRIVFAVDGKGGMLMLTYVSESDPGLGALKLRCKASASDFAIASRMRISEFVGAVKSGRTMMQTALMRNPVYAACVEDRPGALGIPLMRPIEGVGDGEIAALAEYNLGKTAVWADLWVDPMSEEKYDEGCVIRIRKSERNLRALLKLRKRC